MPNRTTQRKAAEWLLRSGALSVGEIGQALRVSRQLTLYWARTSGIDYRARRKAFIEQQLARAMTRATTGGK